MVKTKFAGKKNPFTGEPKMKRVAADKITITNDTLPKHRAITGKYDHLFSSIKPGQSLRVPSESVGSVSQGMRKWMERHNQKAVGRIKANVNYPGDAGYGRVWLLEGGAA